MTTADATSQQALHIGQALLEAYSANDWGRYRGLLAPAFVYEELGTRRRFDGPDAHIGVLEVWKRAFPDAHSTIRHSIASGDTAVLEVVWEATHSGPLESPGGTIPASGKQIHLPAAVALTVQGDRVTSWRHYFDLLALLQQIGAAPESP